MQKRLHKKKTFMINGMRLYITVYLEMDNDINQYQYRISGFKFSPDRLSTEQDVNDCILNIVHIANVAQDSEPIQKIHNFLSTAKKELINKKSFFNMAHN